MAADGGSRASVDSTKLRKLPPVTPLKRKDIVRRIGVTVQGYLFDA